MLLERNSRYNSPERSEGRNEALREKVEAVLAEIRLMLAADGGNIELVDVVEEEGIVKVRLTGACYGCPMATITLREGVEKILKKKVPEVKKVVAV